MKNYNLKMDLQLFADPSASLQNTTGTMTNEMKTFYGEAPYRPGRAPSGA